MAYDRQEPAFGPGENPAAGGKADLDFVPAGRNLDGRVPRRQQHGVIDLGEDRFHDLQQGEEIDHATALVQRAAQITATR